MMKNKTIPKLKSNPKYKDAPRFPLIYEYEGQVKANYKRSLIKMIKEVGISMNSMIKST